MPQRDDYLADEDDALLRQCDVDVYKSSGPGGQHRNKVSSAVRLRHRPTGITVHGDESRSQHQNKRKALGRLRMNLALRLRRPFDGQGDQLPAPLAECLSVPRGRPGAAAKRLAIGRKDRRFWPVAALLLDALDTREGRLAEAAAILGISTSNLVALFKSDRHLLGAAQALRKHHGQKPLS